ncbi:xylulokinase [Agromyces aerolatus]|uniref:xylulokinase n=1 Tax=Agromyces sp. LY-1074 TaxID=3074080 RepID=UPI00285CB672|nr:MULTISPECIES: FGGY-family carbohydrate kinase [unclassified Agromyces]MDR5699519.1 FGGY-family carbohydrate kinase [Agromyces sp. LY-1074]MDR5705815.1 FGGY-family carbohydrate kinase [Agromyces sp. LY-1358]
MNSSAQRDGAARDAILAGRTSLGIELGSTRIKACLVRSDDPATVLASGGHEWENEFVDRVWTYSLEDVWSGLRAAYADLVADVRKRYGVQPETFGAIGISAMMHGYLAFDAAGELLVPFRTWRNTSTGRAAAELSELFGVNIPLRWSIAHLGQAVLDGEPHVPEIDFVTTLAGYVHWRLTGRKVLGVGDASGMFPIGAAPIGAGTADYDRDLLARFDAFVADRAPGLHVERLLPEVLVAGRPAGELTAEGAALLDPSGVLRPGIVLAPPEGDAGTGMVATNAVAPRTGNVSAGTSIFAMVVLERPLSSPHDEVDLVTTPAGDPVAMVHCNNGASELGAWASVFSRFAELAGSAASPDTVFELLFREALEGEPDAGGVIAYNTLAGEPIAGLDEGRPMVVRTPDSRLTLANVMRAQLYGVYGTLALGMRVLADEGVALDRMYAHGGIFRTAGVAQRFLAGALDAPVAVGATASEGGAWGMAVLASYVTSAAASAPTALGDYLDGTVFAEASVTVAEPDPADVAGFARYLDRYRAGLAAEAAAVGAL